MILDIKFIFTVWYEHTIFNFYNKSHKQGYSIVLKAYMVKVKPCYNKYFTV